MISLPAPPASGMTDPAPEALEMLAIVESDMLTDEEKVGKIQAYFARGPRLWMMTLHQLERVDEERARSVALYLFRRPTTSRLDKYALGHYLLRGETPTVDRRPGDPEGFIPEYSAFLVNAILNGGRKEFCVPKPGTRTAVGEYAGIAGGINGPQRISFSDVADSRVVPVLIACLSAPDHVYPLEQGHVIRGTLGEPTGRNTQRQGIPLALEKLRATQAIPVLRRILFSHHDYYLRYGIFPWSMPTTRRRSR